MCRCRDLSGWDLVKCLAPPRGEYEYNVELKGGVVLAVNREGFFRRVRKPVELLPFIDTMESSVEPEELEAKGILSVEDVLCGVLDSLFEAAVHGSTYSSSLIKECRDLVRSLEEDCRRRS